MYRFDRSALLKAPEGFGCDREVAFQDVDAAGLVFFATAFVYMHEAYAAFMAHAGTPLPEVIASGKWLAPLRHAEADYLHPLRFGDQMRVSLVAAHLEETETTIGYRISVPARAQVCTVGQSVHAFLDRDFQRIPVVEPLRAALVDIGE